MVALAQAGGPKRRLAHRKVGEHARRRGGIAQGQRPAVPARGGLECEDRAEPPVDQRLLQPPVFQEFRHQVHGVALADGAQIDLYPVGRRANLEVVGVKLQRRQPRADRGVERAAGQVEQMARDDEALQRRGAHPNALARREVVDACDVAVGPETAQLALEPIREVERGLRRLRRIPDIGMDGVHLEDGGHRLVREPAHVAQIARGVDPDPAVDVRPIGTHGRISYVASAGGM